MMCMLKILDRFPDKFPAQESQELFTRVMTSIPLTGDSSENETVIKFAGNLVAKGRQAEIVPYMDNLTATCLKIINDKNCAAAKIKIRAASFIKNVVMNAGQQYIQKLQVLEGQMNAFEREQVAKFMAKVPA